MLVLAVLLGAGCYQQAYVVSGTVPEGNLADREWRHYLLAGLIPLSDDVELRSVCPQGVSRIESGQNVLHVLISVLTAFLYAPSSVEIWCQAAGAPPPGGPAPASAGPPHPSEQGSVPIVEHPAHFGDGSPQVD